MSDDNIWSDAWDPGEDWSGGGARAKRLPRGLNLGASVYELGPGNWVPFHFHHGAEELLVVLRGRPTLRTGKGERELDEGEAVYLPTGPDGVHGLSNKTEEPVRFLAFSNQQPDIVVRPDSRSISVVERRPEGGGLSQNFSMDDSAGYFDFEGKDAR